MEFLVVPKATYEDLTWPQTWESLSRQPGVQPVVVPGVTIPTWGPPMTVTTRPGEVAQRVPGFDAWGSIALFRKLDDGRPGLARQTW